MRRINGILAVAVLIMFIVHGIFGALNMMNIAPLIAKVLSHTMLTLIAVHAVISVGLSVQSVRSAVRTIVCPSIPISRLSFPSFHFFKLPTKQYHEHWPRWMKFS